ncbi:MAG: polysaccharide biosynthesis/export family protein [Candidatus Korobacteraceae bacterium]
MSLRFGDGALSAVLFAAMAGLVCGVSAQVQTPSTSKAVGSNLPLSSTSNKAASGGASSGESSSASAKTATSSSSVPAADSKASTTPGKVADESYIVGVADSLLISVWKEPDFSGPVVVRPDGIITVPVVGDVHVVGMTTTQVQDLLTEKLKAVVTEPQVTVIVRDIKSRKVYLVGKVSRPGAIALTGHETVLQILADAGGPAPFAKPQKMYLLRTVGDHQKRIQFNYKKVLAGSEPDLELEIGDIIVVP